MPADPQVLHGGRWAQLVGNGKWPVDPKHISVLLRGHAREKKRGGRPHGIYTAFQSWRCAARRRFVGDTTKELIKDEDVFEVALPCYLLYGPTFCHRDANFPLLERIAKDIERYFEADMSGSVYKLTATEGDESIFDMYLYFCVRGQR